MTVREFRPTDEPAIRRLQHQLEYSDPELLSAVYDGPFVGYVAVEQQSGTQTIVGYAIALPGRAVTLSELFVTAGSRGSGYGRALVEAIVAATGAETLGVTTPVENEAARQFYSALGFDLEERISGFYDEADTEREATADSDETSSADALRLVWRQ